MEDKTDDRNDELLDYGQVAERFNLNRNTLQFWVHRGTVPHVRLGPRLVRFRASEFEEFLRRRELRCGDLVSD